MLYGFSGLGQETAQPGWAQMADCLAKGGQWTGTECVPAGVSLAERACVAAGGTYNPATSQCSVGIVTPGQPPPQQPPKKGLSTTGWIVIGALVLGAGVLLTRPKNKSWR